MINLATSSNNLKFKNATITFENDNTILITEYEKDKTRVFDLIKCLKTYENIDGISLTIDRKTQLEGQD